MPGHDALVAACANITSVLLAVRWQYDAVNGCKELVSDITVEVDLQLPPWFIVPKQVVRSTGNAVMRGVLGAAVPRFLAQLERDYRAWAAGDTSRQPLGEGELL